MRAFLVLVHRYIGLLIAPFLIVSGLTGAIIAWDRELDAVLNAHLTEARSDGPARSSIYLARELERRDPRVRVTLLPLAIEPGKSLLMEVEPRMDPATGRAYEPGYNEVFVDPASGAELGRRDWGAVWPITRENLLSFLYVMHLNLHIPEMWSIALWGYWLLGSVALIWTVESIVGFFLTLPVRRQQRASTGVAAHSTSASPRTWLQRWRPAWRVRWSASGAVLNFDVHRAFALWTWPLLLALAFTGFALNLHSEVIYPLLSRVSQVTPSPYDLRSEGDGQDSSVPRLGFEEIVARATEEGQRRGWPDAPGEVYYSHSSGIYSVSFYSPGHERGTAGAGPPTLHFDDADGRLLGAELPWEGTAADLVVQAQFPLHSGRVIGLPGRILVSLMGLVVATLSVTGIVIWAKRRRLQPRTARNPLIEATGNRRL